MKEEGILAVRRLAARFWQWLSRLLETLTGFSLIQGSLASRKRWKSPGLGLDCVLRERVLFAARGQEAQLNPYDPLAFATLFYGYTNVEKGLLDDNATLMAVTEERAVFAVTKDNMDVYNSSISPFIYVWDQF